MNCVLLEKSITDQLHRLRSDYETLERAEGVVIQDDKEAFMQAVALAENVMKMRALRRDNK